MQPARRACPTESKQRIVEPPVVEQILQQHQMRPSLAAEATSTGIHRHPFVRP